METTSVDMSITDEQIAEIEALANVAHISRSGHEWYSKNDFWWWTDTADEGDFLAVASPNNILALISRLRAAERDAARYRWLRDSGNFSPSAFGNGWSLNCGYTRTQPSLLDAAIDAAMEGEQQ